MCGICGFSGEGSDSDIDSMMSAMAYRGPDDRGAWTDGVSIYLGHLRLSILDHSDGHQPMVDAKSELVVVYNGEIYNHAELRRYLQSKGHQFTTNHSDTEILIHGYREWGEALPEKLNGMWSFAIVDQKEGRIFFSRDRFGKKPFYYSKVGATFVFSSELKSITQHPIVSSDVDRANLLKYFAHGYLPSPTTSVSGVKKLPAGHSGSFDLRTRSLKIERYWRLRFEPDSQWLGNSILLQEELVRKLYDAVKTRLRADVPVGVFLSGGIDSSSVAAMSVTAAKGGAVRSYSIGFNEESFDESGYAHDIARLLGTDHVLETLSLSRCQDLLEPIYKRLDEPMADPSLVPSFLVCELAAKHVKVALGGDGADELFAGYDPFKALGPSERYFRFVPALIHKLVVAGAELMPVSHQNMSLEFKIKRFLSGLGYSKEFRNPIWLGSLPPDQLAHLFGERISLGEVYQEAIAAWEAPGTEDDVSRTLQFYTELYLQNGILTKMDRAGMLNSLEVRSPFLDIEFVNLVRTIPSSMKYFRGQTKSILKSSLSQTLPFEILHRKKKGFGIPIGKWIKGKQILIEPDALDGIVDTKVTKKLYQDHLKGKADWRSFLWAHYVFEQWLNQRDFCGS